MNQQHHYGADPSSTPLYKPYADRPTLSGTRWKPHSLDGEQYPMPYEHMGQQDTENMMSAAAAYGQTIPPSLGAYSGGVLYPFGATLATSSTPVYQSQSAPPPRSPPPPLPHASHFPTDPLSYPMQPPRIVPPTGAYSSQPSSGRYMSSGGGYVPTSEYEQLKQDYVGINDKLNYVMNSIRTFWSPELKKERQQRKEEAYDLQHKLCQQSLEIQLIRSELERREKDITRFLAEPDTDMMDVEEELRRLRKQLHEPRDLTDKSMSLHEFQTMRAKMERSEIELAERSRDLQDTQVQLKNAKEQKAELERKNEVLSHANTANESQTKFLHEDLEVLRLKLETKNQQLEGKDKSIKRLEAELDGERNKASELSQTILDSERRAVQLTHRLDQLESLLRDRDSQVDGLKQRLLQHPDKRAEAELNQRLENAEQDKQKLEEVINQLRESYEIDQQSQLHSFQAEAAQLNGTIENLQKELEDRLMLIGSQNEKISQLDSISNGAAKQIEKQKREREAGASGDLVQELDEARKEIDRLLRAIKLMEKEKGADAVLGKELDGSGKAQASSDSLRIKELEEALQESLSITAERDKQIAEQKRLVEQLSTQVNELYKSPRDSQQQAEREKLQSAVANAETLQQKLDEERTKHLHQISSARKELGMVLVREKEACIRLLQGPPDSILDKINLLVKQKDLLKHQLLASHNGDGAFSTGVGGPYLGNAWQQFEQLAMQPPAGLIPQSMLPSYTTSRPINIAIPGYGQGVVGVSAPASLTGYTRHMDDGADDGGIWA